MSTNMNANIIHEQANIENLILIAKHTALRADKGFGMPHYMSIPLHTDRIDFKGSHWSTEAQTAPACNTVNCIIGDCPQISISFLPYQHEGWGEYSERITGIDDCSNDWEYLFGSDWGYDIDDQHPELGCPDNTPEGAAKRIMHYIEEGLPDDWEEQMQGHAELSYADYDLKELLDDN